MRSIPQRRSPASWALALASTLGGCGYSWTVGETKPDASAETVFDAGVALPAVDAAPDAATVDASPAADCAALKAKVKAALVTAKNCSDDGVFCKSVADKCGCAVSVGTLSTMATMSFVAATNALTSSGCALDCADTCNDDATSSVCANGACQ